MARERIKIKREIMQPMLWGWKSYIVHTLNLMNIIIKE